MVFDALYARNKDLGRQSLYLRRNIIEDVLDGQDRYAWPPWSSPKSGGRVLEVTGRPERLQGSLRGQAAHRFGDLCWELDAMKPNDLRARVTAAIEDELDHEAWNRYLTAEQVERESITKTLKAWKSISGLARE